MRKLTGCAVCMAVPPVGLIELDLILADPLRWPATVWGSFTPPVGGLPSTYRRFGAMAMGEAWLAERHPELGISKVQLRRHLEQDVPPQAADLDGLVARGLVSRGEGESASMPQKLDPLAYMRLFNKGILLAERSVDLMSQRIEHAEALGEEVPAAQLERLASLGIGLAKTQALIIAKGQRIGEASDEDDGFRAKEASPRMGHSRVRQIEGENRPVHDEGQADRDHYNERARDEGSPTIGGR
jgi:hypothetical protein